MTSTCTRCDPNLSGRRRGEHHFSGRFGDWHRLTVVIRGDVVVRGVYEIEVGEISKAWVLARPLQQCGNCGQRSALNIEIGPFDVRSLNATDPQATTTMVAFRPDLSNFNIDDTIVTTFRDGGL